MATGMLTFARIFFTSFFCGKFPNSSGFSAFSFRFRGAKTAKNVKTLIKKQQNLKNISNATGQKIFFKTRYIRKYLTLKILLINTFWNFPKLLSFQTKMFVFWSKIEEKMRAIFFRAF